MSQLKSYTVLILTAAFSFFISTQDPLSADPVHFASFEIAHEGLQKIQILAEKVGNKIDFQIKAVDQKKVEHSLQVSSSELVPSEISQGLTIFDLKILAQSSELFPLRQMEIHIDAKDPLNVKGSVSMQSGINASSFKVYWSEQNLPAYYSYFLEDNPPETIRNKSELQYLAGLVSSNEPTPESLDKAFHHYKVETIKPPSTTALANIKAANLSEFWHQLDLARAKMQAHLNLLVASEGLQIDPKYLDPRIHLFKDMISGEVKIVGEIRLLKTEVERLKLKTAADIPNRLYILFDRSAQITLQEGLVDNDGTLSFNGSFKSHLNNRCWLSLMKASSGIFSTSKI